MGSYWEDKAKYEREKREDETNRAILGILIAVVGAILTFIFSKLLAPIVSKYPLASFLLIVAIGVGCYFYFTQVDDFEDFASKFSQNESYCRQHIGQVVSAEGYKKYSYEGSTLSAKTIMASIIGNTPKNYTGDGVENELCYGQFLKISDEIYVYQLKKVSDSSLIKQYEFSLDKKKWYLTKIQRGDGTTLKSSEQTSASTIPASSSNKKTNLICVEGFNIYIPKGFIEGTKMRNTYVLLDNNGDISMYFSYEILSQPKGPWDLNPDACEADYTSNDTELYVSKNGNDNEYSSIWREYKKNGKWCLLTVDYDNDDYYSRIYDFLSKSN